jgi:predicted nucleic acid-binding protein
VSGRSFLDTNVLVYAHDADEPDKRERAQTVLAELPAGSAVISSQVLGEFFWATTRRLRTRLPVPTATAAVTALAKLEVIPIDAALVGQAIARAASSQLAYWDALIVEAALAAGCSRLLTEDLAAGSRFGDLEVVNPFA